MFSKTSTHKFARHALMTSLFAGACLFAMPYSVKAAIELSASAAEIGSGGSGDSAWTETETAPASDLFWPSLNTTGDFTLIITGGTATAFPTAGYNTAASGNTLIVNSDTNIEFSEAGQNSIFGGFATSGDSSNNKVYMGYKTASAEKANESAADITFVKEGNLLGANTESGNANNNELYLSSRASAVTAIAGSSRGGDANGNILISDGASLSGLVGATASGMANNNSVTVLNGASLEFIFGGQSDTGLAENNTVTLGDVKSLTPPALDLSALTDLIGGTNITIFLRTGNTLQLAQHVVMSTSAASYTSLASVGGFDTYEFYVNNVTGADDPLTATRPFLTAKEIELGGDTTFAFANPKRIPEGNVIDFALLASIDVADFLTSTITLDPTSDFELVGDFVKTDRLITVKLRSKGTFLYNNATEIGGSGGGGGCTVSTTANYDLALLLLAFCGLVGFRAMLRKV